MKYLRPTLILALIASLCLLLHACSAEDIARANQLAAEAQTRAKQAEQALATANEMVATLKATIEALKPAAAAGDKTASDMLLKAQDALTRAQAAIPTLASAAETAGKLAADAQVTLTDLEKQAKDNGGQIPWYVAVGTFALHYAPSILARVGLGAVPGIGPLLTGLAGIVANINWSAQATKTQRKEDEDAMAAKALLNAKVAGSEHA